MTRRLSLLFAVVLLADCASAPPGTFRYGGWPSSQTMQFHSDGSFIFEFWSDDGGTVCKAFGTWKELLPNLPGIYETSAQRHELREGLRSEDCGVNGVQRWLLRGRSIYRIEAGPFRRVRERS